MSEGRRKGHCLRSGVLFKTFNNNATGAPVLPKLNTLVAEGERQPENTECGRGRGCHKRGRLEKVLRGQLRANRK